MKKFYVIFFAGCVLSSVLLYFPIGWFLGGLAVTLILVTYQFFTSKLLAAKEDNDRLQHQMSELQLQLDNSLAKELRASKEATEIRQQKQGLLSIISHEVRTPMNGIMGMSALLAETPLTNEQQEYTRTIQQSGENLLTAVNEILVNDILHFSKLEQDGAPLEYKDFDLRDCVEEVLEMFAAKAGKANIDLSYYMADTVPAQVIGDNKRLRQVLMNLVENAVRHTIRGEVVIELTTHKRQGSTPPELIVEVRDSGIGISDNQVSQLFKGLPPKEIKGIGSKPAPAAGLGLVVCKKLVDMMGGNIYASSRLGAGSTFRFSIPVIPSMKSTRNQTNNETLARMEGRRILIVDDNEVSRAQLAKRLEDWKIVVHVAESPASALKTLVNDRSIDLVLVDQEMPEMKGNELIQSIRNHDPGMMAILMVPAGTQESYTEATSVLIKPIRQAMLRDHLLRAIAEKATPGPVVEKVSEEEFNKQYPLRILVAEDNLINQKIALKILGKLGYQPAIANNGKEVLEMVSNEFYDLILMDVQMPQMDGLEATRMIRTCLEVQPVIIAVTANVMQGDRDQCMQAGMDDYISKPIDMKELIAQLEKWGSSITSRKKLSA